MYNRSRPRPALLDKCDRTAAVAESLWMQYQAQPNDERLRQAYNLVADMLDMYLVAWHQFVALGCNDDWRVGA